MEIKFYAACLASYNNGILHGEWIEATSDKDEMSEAVQKMLTNSPIDGAEEWQIHDYDDEVNIISHLGEMSDLGNIAARMEAFEEIEDDYDNSVLEYLFKWVADKVVEPYNYKSTIEDCFGGIHDDAEDYAAEQLEAMGTFEGLPEIVSTYFDAKAFARDMALNGEVDFICTSTGQHLQDYDSMRGRERLAMYNR